MYFAWSIFKKLSSYIEFITFTFISIYLWEQTNTLYPVLVFCGIFFATSPLGSILSVYITNKESPKIALLLSSLFLTAQTLIFLLFLNDYNINQLIAIGFLGGMGAGLKIVAEYTYERIYEALLPEYIVQATKQYWSEIIKLFTLFFSAYIAYKGGGFQLLFQIILIALILSSILIIFFTNQYNSKTTNIVEIFKIPGSNPLKAVIIKSEFLDGIYDGINTTLLPATLLYFVGDLLDWGLINTLLIVFSVFFNIIVTKTSNNITYKNYYVISAILLGGVSILLISNFNIFVLLGYMLIMTMYEVSGMIGYNTTIEDFTGQDPQKNIMLPEYKLLTETFFNIGRVIPVIVLLLLGFNQNDEFLIQSSLTVSSILPILVISIFGNTIVYNLENKPEVSTTNIQQTEI